MKIQIKINPIGFLSILRSSDNWVAQECPHAPVGKDGALRMCGDWCPQFGIPKAKLSTIASSVEGISRLPICHGRIWAGMIIDERPQKPEKPK